MSDEMTPDEYATMHLTRSVLEDTVDKMVYRWRVLNIHCTDDGCVKGDVTEDSVEFCKKIMEGFETKGNSINDVAALLTVAITKLATFPVDEPKHMWIADGRTKIGTKGQCSCGEHFETFDHWAEHAGEECLVDLPIYQE